VPPPCGPGRRVLKAVIAPLCADFNGHSVQTGIGKYDLAPIGLFWFLTVHGPHCGWLAIVANLAVGMGWEVVFRCDSLSWRALSAASVESAKSRTRKINDFIAELLNTGKSIRSRRLHGKSQMLAPVRAFCHKRWQQLTIFQKSIAVLPHTGADPHGPVGHTTKRYRLWGPPNSGLGLGATGVSGSWETLWLL